MRRLAIILCFCSSHAAITVAQTGDQEVIGGFLREPDSREDADRIQRQKVLLKEFYRAFAGERQFSLDSERSLKLAPKPVMSWTGMERSGFTSGDVFVWHRDGRAEVIGCIGSIPYGGDRRYLFQEYHALTAEPLQSASLAVAGKWAPETPGVSPTPLASAAPPSDSDTRRLIQMRRLAREFQPFKAASEDDEERLRLLPQPIYRFDIRKLQEANSDVVDGAVFAYVWTNGTDPELLLLIECRRVDDELQWTYAPVRFTWRPLSLHHQGEEIWSCVNDSGRSMRGPYVTAAAGVMSYDEIDRRVEASSDRGEIGSGSD
ncbi:MAG: hypothetical protein AAF961_03995 [Planctomycetota bacterium]